MRKIKVVWVCHLSNPAIRKNLKFAKWTPMSIVRRLIGKNQFVDFAVWNTNAIREFEHFLEDVDLHIVAPHYGICGKQYFEINGIKYYFFQSEDDYLLSYIKKQIIGKGKKGYQKNTKCILEIIDKIKPDIIHYIGAENPYYSESALSIPINIPMIVSLQTLMCDPNFKNNYPISEKVYNYRSTIERQIIKRADYVATTEDYFRKIIKQQLGDIKFLDMTLALGVKADHSFFTEKKYDFVYFAVDISKAVDYAIEAFARAKRIHNNITLHVVGGFSESLMIKLKKLMDKLELSDGIDFTGKLPTYNDVIAEVRKARFALLPLKIDLVSSTIRESMANGLPVITTITPATPQLNEKRECVLLSEKGNFEAMAVNMCKLLENDKLENKLRKNGIQTIQEMYDNNAVMLDWKKNYINIFTRGRK